VPARGTSMRKVLEGEGIKVDYRIIRAKDLGLHLMRYRANARSAAI